MSLADLIAGLRSGIVQISFRNNRNEHLGGGTGFLSRGNLLTNHHVFVGHLGAASVKLRRECLNPIVLSPVDFAARLRSGSEEDSFDYAIMDVPELMDGTEHQFLLEPPGNRRIGDAIGILGYPLEHTNLAFHQGIISSFYMSNITNIIQLDASINANSDRHRDRCYVRNGVTAGDGSHQGFRSASTGNSREHPIRGAKPGWRQNECGRL